MTNNSNKKLFSHVALITNHQKDLASATHTRVLSWLSENDVSVTELVFETEHNFKIEADLVIAIGGDGTMLNAARIAAPNDIPLVGINRGSLGFLADISPETVENDLVTIFKGDGLTEDRLLLHAKLFKNEKVVAEGSALNDVVLKHDNSGRMMHFDTSVNAAHLNSHYGDGIIIATPTGSTAYALSCGGPILSPELPVISLTPICPHTLSDRPIVIPASSQIELKLHKRTETAVVSLDGQEFGELHNNMYLEIVSAPNKLRLIHPPNYNYYAILRGKLHWGEQKSR